MDESYRYWLAAFQHMVETKKFTQVALVERIKEVAPTVRVTKGHLNAVYKERKGRGKPFKASIELQAAIAKAYDFDYLEFLKAGQKILNSQRSLDKTAGKSGIPDELSQYIPLYPEWSAEDFKDFEISDFDQKIEEYISIVHDDHSRYASLIGNRIKAVAKNRNQIELERIHLLSILEASTDAIKVNRADDKVVIYENQAYKRLIGRSLLWKPCPGLCGDPDDECYVDEVRIKGSSVHTIREWNGRWYEIIANPINKDGILHSVVAVIRDTTKHYSKSKAASHANARLDRLLNITSDTVNFFDENKQMTGSTFHHVIEGVERPHDLNSFIIYAGHLFHGVNEAYEKLLRIYTQKEESEFTAVHKISGNRWLIKGSPVYDQDEFIGIMIVSRELG
jgi:PAS domain-containing protein